MPLETCLFGMDTQGRLIKWKVDGYDDEDDDDDDDEDED